MKDELSYQESLIFADLLSAGLRESDARAVAVAQSRECGDLAMSPFQMDIHIPNHGMSLDTQMWVSDLLEEIIDEDSKTPSVECPFCGQQAEGTVYEMGLFLLAHQAYHAFEINSSPMYEEDEA